MSVGASERLSAAEIEQITNEALFYIQKTYQPGKDRLITTENVYQPAQTNGLEVLESFISKLLLPGSAIKGLPHLDTCLEQLQRGESVIFLPEHRGNLDVPSFQYLLKQTDPRYHSLSNRMVYIAGRKLNEDSDTVKMITEKYARLIVVPRRDFPPQPNLQDVEAQAQYEEFSADSAKINRAAFRQMQALKKDGKIMVMFPLGGRWKQGADNIPVPETTSYLQRFKWAYLLSMEGNALPPLSRMEDERPEQAKVVFTFSKPIATKTYLAKRKAIYESESLPQQDNMGFEQATADHILKMLEHLRLKGDCGEVLE